MKIKQSIFNGTILKDLPFNYKWNENRPSILYDVNETGITINSYASKESVMSNNKLNDIRRLVAHDICHAILYCKQDKIDKLFKPDFGLSWESSDHIDGVTIFFNVEELMDEMRVIVLSHLILDNMNLIYDKSYFLYYYKEHFSTLKYAHGPVNKMWEAAHDYWYKDVNNICSYINILKVSINNRYKKARN